MNTAQTATEYLIIMAVVIVIALIVVGVMGGFDLYKMGGYRDEQKLAEKFCEENGMVYYWHSVHGNAGGEIICLTPEEYGSNRTTTYKVDWEKLQEGLA